MSPASTNWPSTMERRLIWLMLGAYAIARVLQVWPGRVPMLGVVLLHVLPPAIFALLHGRVRYGWRGICVFFGICVVVGNIFENVGVLTGFPFGHYFFTNLMGPKIFAVPILLGFAYVGIGYLSWSVGRLIVAGARGSLGGSRVVMVPVVGAFVMVAWDLAMDPVWATILHAWVWVRGGSYFGVPLMNFFGWYLTVYVIYQTFAIYLRRREDRPEAMPRGYWQSALLFYGTCAAGNALLLMGTARGGAAVVFDPSGALWRVSSIVLACALVSVCVMGGFTLLAWMSLKGQGAGADLVDEDKFSAHKFAS
jgi:uncharacterized membrane protein